MLRQDESGAVPAPTPTAGAPAAGAARTAWAGPALLAVAFVTLTAWSWRKWPDVQIDFGAQLYFPWQLAAGKLLYVDLASKNGPLSQYFDAALFRLFGVSLTTLVVTNLAILAALTALVYRTFARSCDRTTATLAGVVLLGVFGFSQYTLAANYNHVCPYQHEQTHGLVLGIAMLACLGAWGEGGGRRAPVAAGICLGLVALTKAELFLPALVAAAIGVTMVVTGAWGARRPGAATFVAGALLPPLAFFAFLAARMPAADAWRGVAGNLAYLGGDALHNRFRVTGMGLDDPVGNLTSMIRLGVGLIVVALVAMGADGLVRRGGNALAAGVGVATVAFWLLIDRSVPWIAVGHLLPPVAFAAAIGCGVTAFRRPALRRRLLPLVSFAAYALVLLGKMGLDARVYQYGFVLALPATLLLVAGLACVVPARARRWGGDGRIAQAICVATVLAGVLHHLAWSNAIYARKNLPVGSDGDAMLAGDPDFDPRGLVFAQAARALADLMPPGATLLPLPEGALLNYWLRRPNPSRFSNVEPEEMAVFGGEPAVLADIAAHPPDFIALVHRDVREYGYDYFGRDPAYGRQIMEWIGAHYRRVRLIGAEPFQNDRFGIAILRRTDAP